MYSLVSVELYRGQLMMMMMMMMMMTVMMCKLTIIITSSLSVSLFCHFLPLSAVHTCSHLLTLVNTCSHLPFPGLFLHDPFTLILAQIYRLWPSISSPIVLCFPHSLLPSTLAHSLKSKRLLLNTVCSQHVQVFLRSNLFT